jgi:molybdopterin/thiamine biosynthesis adenylyltransferase/rhodanese-related sulfurtransferase/molybdopterin converting factor small subunit
MAKVIVPTPLRPYAGKQESVELSAPTVGALLDQLVTSYADLRRHLYTDDGKLRSFVNIYVNDEDIRYLQKEDTPVEESDIVSIVPSIAGGRPTDTTAGPRLSQEEILRYSRHLIMPEVGMEGQLKLKQAKVLLIGAGGLGAPLGLYLTAAGVGTIGLVDFDKVDFTNLQRQVTFGTKDVGRPKLEAARERLQDLNPETKFVLHETRLSSDNALDILRDYDIVVDGTDNFPTRYLVNDACVLLGKPNVYGSIFRFEGQATVFALPDGPCYRCLYPEPPPPGLVPSCAEGGVLGVLPGIVGALQANETIKLIIGRGEPLKGRLLLFDALKMSFRELKLRKNPDCPVCGAHPTVTKLIDYEEFCGIRGEEAQPTVNHVPEITPTELKQKLDAGEDLFILDVREPHEVEICHLNGHLIPLGDLPDRVHELDSARNIVAYCRSGVRSARAVAFLQQAGFRKVWNLQGGILAWSDQVDPSVPKY